MPEGNISSQEVPTLIPSIVPVGVLEPRRIATAPKLVRSPVSPEPIGPIVKTGYLVLMLEFHYHKHIK